MGGFTRFEDIDGWKLARKLTQQIYIISGRDNFSKDRDLKSQIRRAAVSIMSNIAEGFERGGNQEFTQFLFTAKASCAEVTSQLYVALNNKFISKEKFDILYELAGQTKGKIVGLIKYLQNHKSKGLRNPEL